MATSAPDLPRATRDGERQVLGAMLFSRDACRVALERLDGHHFWFAGNRIVFEVLRQLYVADSPIDPAILRHHLADHPRVKDLNKLVDAIVQGGHGAENVNAYVGIVLVVFARRELVRYSRALADREAKGGDFPDMLAFAEAELIALRRRLETADDTFATWGKIADMWDERMADSENDPERGITTPFHELNSRSDDYRPGRLYVLGGWPGDGKSIIAMQVAIQAARLGKAVAFISIEMSLEDMVGRTVTALGVPYEQAESGKVTELHRARARSLQDELRRYHGGVVDDPGATADKVATYARIMRPDLVIVDHLHQIQYRDRMELEAQVRGFAALARRERVPVLLLAQFHRGTRDDFPRPTMKSFRESAVIEMLATRADAIFRHRSEENEALDSADYMVMKNRFGRTYGFGVELDRRLLVYNSTRESAAATW